MATTLVLGFHQSTWRPRRDSKLIGTSSAMRSRREPGILMTKVNGTEPNSKRHSGRRNRGGRLAADHGEGSAGRDNSRHPSPDSEGFRSTPAQLKYLVALRAACLHGEATSDVAMAAKLRMSRQTLWEWRQRRGFCAWLARELRAGDDLQFELAIARHLHLAIRGSVKSFAVIVRAKEIGLIKSREAGARQLPTDHVAGMPYTVHVVNQHARDEL